MRRRGPTQHDAYCPKFGFYSDHPGLCSEQPGYPSSTRRSGPPVEVTGQLEYDEDLAFALDAAMHGGVTPAPRPTIWARLVAFVTRRPARLPRAAAKTWIYTPPEPDEPAE